MYIYPASPKAKFNEAFCNRPSLTRSFGLIEISPFSPHAHRRQAFRTLVLPKLQENLRNFAQSHMKNHSVLQKTQHVLKKKSTAVLAMRFFAHFSLIRAISSSKLMQVHKDWITLARVASSIVKQQLITTAPQFGNLAQNFFHVAAADGWGHFFEDTYRILFWETMCESAVRSSAMKVPNAGHAGRAACAFQACFV